jgi:hypothetical protein
VNRILLASFFALIAIVEADAQAVKAVFTSYCAVVKPAHAACTEPLTSDAYRWLVLDEECRPSNQAGHCADFRQIRDTSEPCVVAYNHRTGRWRPRNALENSEKWAFDVDGGGLPTVVMKTTAACQAIVEDTRPLTYGVQLGKAEEKDNEVVAPLTDLLSLVGGTLAAATSALSKVTPSVKNFQGLDSTLSLKEFDRQVKAVTPDPFEVLAASSWGVATRLLIVADMRGAVIAATNRAETSPTAEVGTVSWHDMSLDAAKWQDAFSDLRAARETAIAALGGAVPDDKQKATLEQSQKVLEREGEVAKTVAALNLMRDRWSRYVIGTRSLTWMPVVIDAQRVRWNKSQTHPFTVLPTSPFAAEISQRSAKADTSLTFVSPKASMFGVGAGLIWTGVSESTYKAQGKDGEKKITETERDGRSGQVAVFIDWRFVQVLAARASAWRVHPVVQVGVGADTKAPSLFVGAGLEAVKWIRLSVGRTWQNVKKLDGQDVNAPVADDASIRTRDRFVPGRYAAISIAIDGLPLFKGK